MVLILTNIKLHNIQSLMKPLNRKIYIVKNYIALTNCDTALKRILIYVYPRSKSFLRSFEEERDLKNEDQRMIFKEKVRFLEETIIMQILY